MIVLGGNLEQLVLIITFLLLAYTWVGYAMLLLLLRALIAREVIRAQLGGRA